MEGCGVIGSNADAPSGVGWFVDLGDDGAFGVEAVYEASLVFAFSGPEMFTIVAEAPAFRGGRGNH